MAWHDEYTKAEIENLMTNMCNWIGTHLDDYYNYGDIVCREALIDTYVELGFHEDEVRSWYDWLEE